MLGIGKPYLALYDLAGNYSQSSVTSFLGYGEESYLVAAAKSESGVDYVYAAGFATTAVGTQAYVIGKYDASGNRMWSVVNSGSEGALTGVVALGSRLFAAGYTYTAVNGYDVVIREFDPTTGAVTWSDSFGGPRDDKAFGITTDGSDLYVVGESRSFASPAGNAVGEADVMMLHYVFGNHPPVANAGPDQTVSAAPTCTASV